MGRRLRLRAPDLEGWLAGGQRALESPRIAEEDRAR
jgi:hypothetical protein